MSNKSLVSIAVGTRSNEGFSRRPLAYIDVGDLIEVEWRTKPFLRRERRVRGRLYVLGLDNDCVALGKKKKSSFFSLPKIVPYDSITSYKKVEEE